MKLYCNETCYFKERVFNPNDVLISKPGEAIPPYFQKEQFVEEDLPETSDGRQHMVEAETLSDLNEAANPTLNPNATTFSQLHNHSATGTGKEGPPVGKRK